MNRERKYRRLLFLLLFLDSLTILSYAYIKLNLLIPNELKITVDNVENIDFNLPFNVQIFSEDVDVISVNTKKLAEEDINKTFTIESSKTGNYNIDLKLFGFIKLKSISLDVVDNIEVIPCGIPVGIYVETDGLLVLGTSQIMGVDGVNYDPANKLLKSGDYIVSINNKIINNKNDFIKELKTSNGEKVSLIIRRNGSLKKVSVIPVETASNEYKIGVWVRDNTQGIGTLTFIDDTGNYGALGHGINDVDTSLLIEIGNGYIYDAEVLSIIKGKKGEPGELIGLFNYAENKKFGIIDKNTQQGIFGKINENIKSGAISSTRMKIGFKQDIKLGKAYIRCSIDGISKDYEINIEKIDMSNSNQSKGLVIKITDPELLKATNGIVQGMSGSPIIQNNMIVGAVTHVFVQDSTKGYATFIENMIKKIE